MYNNSDKISVRDCKTGLVYHFTDNTIMKIDCREFGYNEILDLKINILFGNNYTNNGNRIKFTLLYKDSINNIQLIVECMSFSFEDIIYKFINKKTKIILEKSRAEHYYLYYDKEDKTYVKEYIEKLKNEANEFCKDVFKI